MVIHTHDNSTEGDKAGRSQVQVHGKAQVHSDTLSEKNDIMRRREEEGTWEERGRQGREKKERKMPLDTMTKSIT